MDPIYNSDVKYVKVAVCEKWKLDLGIPIRGGIIWPKYVPGTCWHWEKIFKKNIFVLPSNGTFWFGNYLAHDARFN